MKIFVLGGSGRQGSVIAKDLSRLHDVVTLDVKTPPPNMVGEDVDCSDYKALRKHMPKADLVVGALPSHLGMNAIMAAIDSGSNYVDLSFCAQDLKKFDAGALHKGITILHDCGVAPGLSHLVAGRAIKQGYTEVGIYVGGVSAYSEDDYVVTWSPEDLLEEYTRPARIVSGGDIKEVPALSGLGPISIPGVNREMEKFYSDGLRSLLRKKDMAPNMAEFTLRWPGHVDKVTPLIEGGNFVEDIQKLYPNGNTDMLIMHISAANREENRHDDTTLVVVGDENMSAMARTTALSCSAFAQLVANGYHNPGVIPPEDVARDDEAYKFMMDTMAEYGVEFDERYPFMEQ